MANKLFNQIQVQKPKNNRFDLSHDVKLSANMGDLIPTLALECVPGDKFKINCESLLRFAPMVAPIMHRVDVSMHYFFVPNRLLWNHWEDFIVGNEVAGVPYAFPTIQMADATWTKLADYLGIIQPSDVGATATDNVNALPFAAYQMIYNEYYRDQNLVQPVPFKCNDGDNTAQTGLRTLRRRAWEHDYFTSALPFAQKGAAVDIPLASGVVELDPEMEGVANPSFQAANDYDVDLDGDVTAESGAPPAIIEVVGSIPGQAVYDPDGSLVVDSGATTINDLRRAFALQRWLEKLARGGSRYIEVIRSMFGVRSSDARLNRPEYITGVKTPVHISEVLNTTGTDTAPQGNMAGHGLAYTKGGNGYYRCEEHGFIIGIMSVTPKPAYVQAVPKHFFKTTDPYQYFWPDFAHIGEQPIERRELYPFQGVTDLDTFGYTPRYAEYKFQPSRVAGKFRTSLDFWHLARKFGASPNLNQAFIEIDPETTDRIFAVTDTEEDKLWCHVLHKIDAVRPMPKFGTPAGL